MIEHAPTHRVDYPMPSLAKSRLWWKAPVAVAVLIFATIAAYGRICGHDFTWWDDPMTIHHNARFNPPSAQLIRETWVKPVDGLYAPVTYSYWGALAFLAETDRTDDLGIHLNPRVYHVASLALHVLTVLVVFAIL